MKYYLAVDLGATSGRHVVGYITNNKIVTKEIHRFATLMDDSSFGLVWNIPRLLNEIKIGIKKAFEEYKELESLSIDTWGVDYVLMEKDKEIYPCYAYRNHRCVESAKKVHKVLLFEELYSRTGIQFAAFNTIYQLYDDKLKGRLDKATDYLMLPSYFTYKLTGVKTHEYTNETTGAIINALTKEYDYVSIDKLGLPRKLFKDIRKPKEFVGHLLTEIQQEVGGNTKVILCASHDTGSAFEAIDIPLDAIMLSSGTWSLLGVKVKEPIINKESLEANYTNEGGVGYIRFLKNIMGMYISNRLKDEFGLDYKYIDSHITDSNYNEYFDIKDPRLNAPKCMKDVILDLLKDNPPKKDIDFFRATYLSMALGYKEAIEKLEEITNKKYKEIHVFGGGAKNVYLNGLIEKYTNKKVIALPIEATALGNIILQMKVGKDL